MNKVVAGKRVPPAPKPIVSASPEKRTWNFSFTYWRQIKNFGLSHVPKGWFVDLLEGLRDTESFLPQLFEADTGVRKKFHYHEVAWTRAKVSIRRKDLDWLPIAILDNEVEFPMCEFSLMRGPLRVVGFWAVNEPVFHLVLVDPHHNIAVAEGFEKGHHCGVHPGDNHRLLCAVDELVCELRSEPKCADVGCAMHEKADRIFAKHALKGIIYVSPDTIDYAVHLLGEKRAKDMDDIFMAGALVCSNRPASGKEHNGGAVQ